MMILLNVNRIASMYTLLKFREHNTNQGLQYTFHKAYFSVAFWVYLYTHMIWCFVQEGTKEGIKVSENLDYFSVDISLVYLA